MGLRIALRERLGRVLARYLGKPNANDPRVATAKPELLAAAVRRGDVLLVEGSSRFSAAIKYLTQSTWSHAALVVGKRTDAMAPEQESCLLIEADLLEGVRLVPLSEYWHFHTRICRPVGLSPREIDTVVAFATAQIGHTYDLRNVFDLVRYLIQTPPVPNHWRRRMLALGSGDPTQAICSSLIAQAFEAVSYPILPDVVVAKSTDKACVACYQEILHIRHHSLYTPRDFDLSPYFRIVKPTLEAGFDPHGLWILDEEMSSPGPGQRPTTAGLT